MFFLLIPIIILAFIKKLLLPGKPRSIENKHVVVTGGSSGIGKCIAILAAKQGAHITIIARDKNRLQQAENEIQKSCISNTQIIQSISADVSSPNIKEKLLDLDEKNSIYMLILCTGMAICGKVEDFTVEDTQKLINTNYLSALYPIQALIPKFKERKNGIIVFTSSQLALMGMYGYSIYASCKFALRGLAESILMELKPYNVSVTLALPADTDTPGYEKENETKPEETKLLSATAGLMKPEIVADKILKDSLIGNFFSYIGFESYVLTTLCVGMSPVNSVLDLIIQVIILGLLRLIGAFYLRSFDKIIQKCHLKGQKDQ